METPTAVTPVKLRILVVDDDANIVKCLRRILVRAGFEVETAGGPREALDRLEAFAPHLVLSDYRMPGMDGAELLAEVKRRLPLVMRVMLSGYADLDSVLASVNQGAVCRFIRKPWDDHELVSVLRATLESQQLLASLYQPLSGAVGAAARVMQDPSRIAVDARVTGQPFTADDAIAIVQRFAASIDGDGRRLIGGVLERHGGTISFVAQVGGDSTLTLEVPLERDTGEPLGRVQ